LIPLVINVDSREHLDNIPVTELANTIKSSVEDLVLTPSESADLSDGESECDVPKNDDSPKSFFFTFDNPLFDSNDDFSSDDESLSEEEIQKDEFKYFSNPLYDLDDEIITNEKILPNQKDLDVVIPIPPGIDERCFNAESDLLESLLNRDSPIDSTKIDSIFDEFSLPRPPEESNSEISDATIESLSPSPILVEDSDSLMEEIDLFLASDDSMPSGIEIDYYDSEGDIRFLEELLSNDSPPLPENESFSLDHFNDPSLSRPPPEPPDVEICFNFEPDAGVVTKKVVGDISFSHFRYGIFDSHRVFDILGPRLLFSLSYNFGLVLSKEYLKFLSLNIFLLGDKNEVFDLGIIVIYVESEVCKSSTEDIPTLFALMKL
ncbi:hypothetical protein Tco_1339831, partial [Tanacetum coccineum]